jgi:hypothetical protein
MGDSFEANVFISQSPPSLVVHRRDMKPIRKELGIYLLIVLGLIAFAVVRALSNILSRRMGRNE